MKLMEFVIKNRAGTIISGLYFLAAYKLLGARISVTRDLLKLTSVAAYTFWIDFAVAVLVGALLQMMIEKYAK